MPFLRTKKRIAITAVVAVLIIGGGLAGLAALRNRGGSGPQGQGQGQGPDGGAELITSDTFFYGQSPPVYPSRKSVPRPWFDGDVAGQRETRWGQGDADP